MTITEISRTALFGKLNPVAYKALESATVFCKLRGNSEVGLAHWLFQLLQLDAADWVLICRYFTLDLARLSRDVTDALDRLPTGATVVSDIAYQVEEAVERSWVYCSLLFDGSQVRSGHLLVGILKTPTLRAELQRISPQFARIDVDDLVMNFVQLLSDSKESGVQAGDGFAATEAVSEGARLAPAQLGKQDALQRYTVDLTAKARRGELDPVQGRDAEIRQLVDILLRRRQNNPILTGEAGVGKTAVVEGLALRLARQEVPPALQQVSLRVLDIGLLQAGASMKGEFEQRLRQLIEEVQVSVQPIILFIDEAHTLIGAGGNAGTGDAANLLKPALARGSLRTIAATTWAEYKKYFEADPALTRRFQVVRVEEPGEEQALAMLRGTASQLETHHGVQILDEALRAAVSLSHRYIPARQLPDKAVSLLDTACARVAIGQNAVPSELENCRSAIAILADEYAILRREQKLSDLDSQRIEEIRMSMQSENTRLRTLERRWEKERTIVTRINEIRCLLLRYLDNESVPEKTSADDTLKGGGAAEEPTPTSISELKVELQALQTRLRDSQGEQPLVHPTVDEQAVASVVEQWTGIPVSRMVRNDIDAVLHLGDTLQQRVLGQRPALELIASRIQTARAKLDNPQRPVGVFLLCGPSGVGKTESALALAEALYGGEQNAITINMTEFQEAHSVSTLKGAPPGYVGYGEGGLLTEAVRRRPYSVILLDEVEKAHRDVLELFFQVFDKGWMEDGAGRQINFRNTVILLTSNVGSDLILAMCKNSELLPGTEELVKVLRQPLLNVFPAAFLGRLSIVPYLPLSENLLSRIVRLQLDRVQLQIQRQHAVQFSYSPAVVATILARCNEAEYGARVVDAIISGTILPQLGKAFLQALMDGKVIETVHVDIDAGELRYNIFPTTIDQSVLACTV